MIILLSAILWYIIGIISFIYWWTDDADFTVGPEIIMAVITGFIGPIAFIVGYCMNRGGGVIFNRRN